MGIFVKNKIKSRYSLPTDAVFNKLRLTEFSRLDKLGQTYLDYTGGNLHPKSLLHEHYNLLQESILGNPHSTNPSSQMATKLVEGARKKIIDFFNAEDYYCIFTSNASGALKIVGECYPFEDNGHYLMTSDNHNSVNGIREYCKSKGAEYTYSPIRQEDLRIDEDRLMENLDSFKDKKNKLFGFPAQSNVSGVKHDWAWVKTAKEKGWDVLLDAAAFVPTCKLDLKEVQPDFVTVSFYKIFGFPTGIGCLLVKKDSFPKLKKHWFAGGTVDYVSVKESNHLLIANHERFENGTLNYLDIPAITLGLEFIESIGIENIRKRVMDLTGLFLKEMSSLKHDNGTPIVRMFGPMNTENRGGTVILNFQDTEGNTFPFDWIENQANKQLISIRSGCFCNPGIDETNHCVSNEEMAQYYTSRKEKEFDSTTGYLRYMSKMIGRMRGATRVSFGIATTTKDIETFVNFVSKLKNKSASSIK
ncbi:MAG: aminotransferase class V-fold PLP-dependent enzyme [Flavobacteriales bacterium]|jgi:molybdenum cofactor sulfurtransferase|nr:aminotransferase class V-fold PLP-dependent enzyme [Flavobacteriales bacterium]